MMAAPVDLPDDAASAASRSVLGRGLLYTFGTAAPVLTNAVVTPFVTRALSTADWGVVTTALVLVQVGMIVAGFGLAAAITRHGILEQSGVGGARSLVLRGAAASLIVCALAAGTARWWSGPLLNVQDIAAMALAVGTAAGFALVVNSQSYLRVLDHIGAFVLLSLTSALGGPALGLLLISVWRNTAAGYLTGLMIGYVTAGLIGLFLVTRGGATAHQRGDTRRALKIGLPTVPHQVALYLASGMLVLVAGWTFGSVQAGRLGLAVLIGSAPGVLTASLNNAWAPVVYRTPAEGRGPVLERTGRDIGFLTSYAAGFVALSAPVLLAIVAPSTYDPRSLTPAAGLVAAGTVLSVLYLCNVHLVFASGRSNGMALVTPLSLLLGTAAAVLAAHTAGLAAIAVGMTVTYAALAIGTFFLARRVSPTRWRWQRLMAPLVLGGLLCALGAMLPTAGLALVVRMGLALGLLVASLFTLLRVRGR